MSRVFEGFIEKLSEKSCYQCNLLVDYYNKMNDELGHVNMEEFYSITKRLIDMEEFYSITMDHDWE